MDAQFWDHRYSSQDQLFSGEPNGVLVSELAEPTNLPPGQALDVGCGEGADALWLARRGWLVTAVDISQVALERAAAAGADVEPRVSWKRGDLTTTPPPVDAFDLVTVHYFPFPRQPDHTALRGLLGSVAPGGTLLFVGHDTTGMPAVLADGHVLADYYEPAEIAELLGADWAVSVNETRARVVPGPRARTTPTTPSCAPAAPVDRPLTRGWWPAADPGNLGGGAVPRPTSGPGAHAVGTVEAKGTLEFSGRRSDVHSPSRGAAGAWVSPRSAEEPS